MHVHVLVHDFIRLLFLAKISELENKLLIAQKEKESLQRELVEARHAVRKQGLTLHWHKYAFACTSSTVIDLWSTSLVYNDI